MPEQAIILQKDGKEKAFFGLKAARKAQAEGWSAREGDKVSITGLEGSTTTTVDVGQALTQAAEAPELSAISSAAEAERFSRGVVERAYSGASGAAQALGAGAARGLSFGLSDVGLRALGVEAENLRDLREARPVLSGIGELGGAVLPALFSGGAGAGGAIARLTPAGMAARAGQGISASRGLVAGMAAEGALFGGGLGITELALTEDPLTIEHTVATMGSEILYGAGTGAGLGVLGSGISRIAGRRAGKAAEVIEEAVAPKAAAEVVEQSLAKKAATGVVEQPLAKKATAGVVEQPLAKKAATGVVEQSLAKKAATEVPSAAVIDDVKLTAKPAEMTTKEVAERILPESGKRVEELISAGLESVAMEREGISEFAARMRKGAAREKFGQIDYNTVDWRTKARFSEVIDGREVFRPHLWRDAMENTVKELKAIEDKVGQQLKRGLGKMEPTEFNVFIEDLKRYDEMFKDAVGMTGRESLSGGFLGRFSEATAADEGMQALMSASGLDQTLEALGVSTRQLTTPAEQALGRIYGAQQLITEQAAAKIAAEKVAKIEAKAAMAEAKANERAAKLAAQEAARTAKAEAQAARQAAREEAIAAKQTAREEAIAAKQTAREEAIATKQAARDEALLAKIEQNSLGGLVKGLVGDVRGAAIGALTGGAVGGLIGGRVGQIARGVWKNRDRVAEGVGNFVRNAKRPRKVAVPAATTILGKIRFDANLGEKPTQIQQKGDGGTYRQRLSELERAVSNKAGIAQGIQAKLSAIGLVKPQFIDPVLEKAIERIDYLYGHAPKPPPRLNPFVADRWAPSQTEITKFSHMVAAAEDPVGAIVDGLNNRRLNMITVQTVRDLYPEIFRSVQVELVNNVDNIRKNVDYSGRVQLSYMFDVPVDPTMQGDFIRAMQSNFMAEAEQQAGQDFSTPAQVGKAPGLTENPTAAQKLEAR